MMQGVPLSQGTWKANGERQTASDDHNNSNGERTSEIARYYAERVVLLLAFAGEAAYRRTARGETFHLHVCVDSGFA